MEKPTTSASCGQRSSPMQVPACMIWTTATFQVSQRDCFLDGTAISFQHLRRFALHDDCLEARPHDNMHTDPKPLLSKKTVRIRWMITRLLFKLCTTQLGSYSSNKQLETLIHECIVGGNSSWAYCDATSRKRSQMLCIHLPIHPSTYLSMYRSVCLPTDIICSILSHSAPHTFAPHLRCSGHFE